MEKNNTPWDQRLARFLVKPLAKTSISPNQVSIFTLFLALFGAGLLSTGDLIFVNIGAGIFVLSRFLDHFDGELARLKGAATRLGYLLDYFAGAISYAAMFLGIGVGFRNHEFGVLAVILGCVGAIASIASLHLNLEIDKILNTNDTVDAIGYPDFAGFELEDGIYLVAPLTWAGYLFPFFILAAIGSIFYTIWTATVLLRVRKKHLSNNN